MKLKNLAVIGLVLAGAVGAVISFVVFAAIINGTPGDDVLTGTAANDVINAFAGNDDITPLAGSDRTDAGGDDDMVTEVGVGNNLVRGGGGDDILDATAATGVNRLFGEDGDDIILGGAGPDRLDGADGNDNLQSALGSDVIYGRDGDDKIDAGAGNDKIYGGPGEDNIVDGPGSDFIEPGEDADTVDVGGAGLATDFDVINLRVGDVPAGLTEKINCIPGPGAPLAGQIVNIILKRNSLGSWPVGTPVGDVSNISGGTPNPVTIIDPLTGGVYEINHQGVPGFCFIRRR